MGATAKYLLALKTYAARRKDQPDIARLMRELKLDSLEGVMAAFSMRFFRASRWIRSSTTNLEKWVAASIRQNREFSELSKLGGTRREPRSEGKGDDPFGR